MENLGICFTGSFCNFDRCFEIAKKLSSSYNLVPIMSFNAATIDTRFGSAKDNIRILEEICGREVIKTIEDAEPIGPKNLTDKMLICPCTGNTLAKLANNIIDTPVTMAVKSHLRNSKPVYIALSTNDGLSGSYRSIAALQIMKNYIFIPYKQDDEVKKPFSLSFLEEELHNYFIMV